MKRETPKTKAARPFAPTGIFLFSGIFWTEDSGGKTGGKVKWAGGLGRHNGHVLPFHIS